MARYIVLVAWMVAAWSAMLGNGHGQSQQEMNAEAAQNFAQADAKLNRAYQQVRAKMDGVALAKLKAAQRAWLAWRDAQADLEADLAARDGSMWPLIYDGARARLTKERTAVLEKLMEDL